MKILAYFFMILISIINCDLNDFLNCMIESDNLTDFFKELLNKIITGTNISNTLFYFIINFKSLIKTIISCINTNTCINNVNY